MVYKQRLLILELRSPLEYLAFDILGLSLRDRSNVILSNWQNCSPNFPSYTHTLLGGKATLPHKGL